MHLTAKKADRVTNDCPYLHSTPLRITGEYIQLTNQLEDILQDVLQINCDDLDPQVSAGKWII